MQRERGWWFSHLQPQRLWVRRWDVSPCYAKVSAIVVIGTNWFDSDNAVLHFPNVFPHSEKESIVSQRNLEKPGDLWKLVFQKRSRIRWVRVISRSVCQLKNLQNARGLSIWTEDNSHCWWWSASWFTANTWSWITTVGNTPPLSWKKVFFHNCFTTIWIVDLV